MSILPARDPSYTHQQKNAKLSEDALICANCHTVNLPNTLICAGCGVNLAQARAAMPHLQELQDAHAAAHTEQLAKDAKILVTQEIASSRQQFVSQLRLLLTIASILGVIIVLSAAFYAYQRYLWREHLKAEYKQALTCLEAEDYVCARDRLAAIIKEDRDYPDAQARLNQARYKLAQQYTHSGQWRAALDELDALLKSSPGDELALILMKDVYNRWVADAINQGDWWTAIRIGLESDLRFAFEKK